MMAPVDFDKLFASYLREKRAVSAAKRFISRGMRFSQRPERLSTEDTTGSNSKYRERAGPTADASHPRALRSRRSVEVIPDESGVGIG